LGGGRHQSPRLISVNSILLTANYGERLMILGGGKSIYPFMTKPGRIASNQTLGWIPTTNPML
jgi:hypothetical protein